MLSCDKQKKKAPGDFEIINRTDIKFDLVFPQELWDEIMDNAPLTINTTKSAYDIFEALSTQVELVDGTKEVLKGKNYRFDFKDFGGEINFDTYLDKSIIGNFRVFFNFPEITADSNIKVYFLSWSKQYMRDGEAFGNGCGYFYDVTSYFKKEVFKKGLLLHTNNYRYLDVIGGRLYFVNYGKTKIQISQITFTDTSLEARMCAERL
jgi:hypothetical protein